MKQRLVILALAIAALPAGGCAGMSQYAHDNACDGMDVAIAYESSLPGWRLKTLDIGGRSASAEDKANVEAVLRDFRRMPQALFVCTPSRPTRLVISREPEGEDPVAAFEITEGRLVRL